MRVTVPFREMQKAVSEFRRAEVNGFHASRVKFAEDGTFVGIEAATTQGAEWPLGDPVYRNNKFNPVTGALHPVPT